MENKNMFTGNEIDILESAIKYCNCVMPFANEKETMEINYMFIGLAIRDLQRVQKDIKTKIS